MRGLWCVCTAVRVRCGLPLLAHLTDVIHTHAVLGLCAHCVHSRQACGCVGLSSCWALSLPSVAIAHVHVVYMGCARYVCLCVGG